MSDIASHAIAFCVLFGVSLGAIIGLLASAIAYIILLEHIDLLGAWTGTMWSICSIFALVGQLITGQVIKRGGMNVVGYWAGMSFLLVLELVGMALWEKMKYDRLKQRDGTIEYGTGLELGPIDIKIILCVSR